MSAHAFFLGECAIAALLASVLFSPVAGLVIMAYALMSVGKHG